MFIIRRVYLFCLIYFAGFLPLFAQTIISQKVVESRGGKLDRIAEYNIKSATSGTGSNGGFIDALEIAEIKNDGFIIRDNYSFSKYNRNLDKEWKATIEKVYGLQSSPTAVTIGDSIATYFVQESNGPGFNQIHITRFDGNGKFIQTVFKIAGAYDAIVKRFVNNGECYILLYSKTKKEATYTILHFSNKDLKATIKPVPALTHAVEWKNDRSGNAVVNYWGYLAGNDKKNVLAQGYWSDAKGSKIEKCIVKTIELDFAGNTSNERTFDLPEMQYKNISWQPVLNLDLENSQLYLHGNLSTQNGKSTDGIYAAKFDYNKSDLLYNKVFVIEDLSDAVVKSVKSAEVKSFRFTAFDCYMGDFLDVENQEMRFMLCGKVDGTFDKFDEKVVDFSIDKNGILSEIVLSGYDNRFFNFYSSGYTLIPAVRKIALENSQKKFLTQYDFLQKLGKGKETSYVLTKCISANDYNLVVSADEKKGTFTAYKLAKESLTK